MYAGKRVRLDLDLLNAPIWQVNRNSVKTVTAGPQQSSSPMKDWPHPRVLRPLRFSKSRACSLRSLPIVKEGWRRQDQRFNFTIEWRDHHHSQHNLLPPTQHTHTHTPFPPLLHRRSFNWVNRTAVKIRSPPKLSFRWLIWKRWSSVIRSRIFYSSLSLSYHQIHPWWKTSWDQAWECTLLIWRVRVNPNTWP